MPLTRVYAEFIIVGRVRPWLEDQEIGVTDDAVSDTSPRLYMDDCIRFSLARNGYPPADPVVVGDAEIQVIAPTLIDRFLDIATVKELEIIRSRIPLSQVGTKSFSDKRWDLDKTIEFIWKQIYRDYGVAPGLGGVTVGAMDGPTGRYLGVYPFVSYPPPTVPPKDASGWYYWPP